MDTRKTHTSSETTPLAGDDLERRKFLATCGKFAVVTSPAVTTLLSTSLTSQAIAKSHGGRGSHANNGYGNGGSDGVPGKSGKNHNDHGR
ncbi:hypothetical protein [Azospirillum rugosum]|uniref:Uncharacterized protein n=1 Tax=Azospirillum rugosum TaxID=416170 RepID=A0ABS4SFU5_9PROT|nr:hypothetical protein [Azospirillum rugosum]MBP2291444.1 hypothetical protein [Azospirillum rugosum]MDQ0525232.1 hypothetical protein [Azospirillum rugosum]